MSDLGFQRVGSNVQIPKIGRPFVRVPGPYTTTLQKVQALLLRFTAPKLTVKLLGPVLSAHIQINDKYKQRQLSTAPWHVHEIRFTELATHLNGV